MGLMLAFNVVRVALNLMVHPSMHTLAMLAVWYMAGGLYLAFFFVISHSFVGAWLLAHINGGLNYQIEHHLFPRVHHSNYHRIAPVVRRVCEQHGIQYVHFPTIWDNVASTFEHL